MGVRRAVLAALVAAVALLVSPARAQADHAAPSDRIPAGDSVDHDAVPAPVDLQMRLKDVRVRHTLHGDTVLLPSGDRTIELSPEQFSYAIAVAQQDLESAGPLYRFLNITRPISLVWIGVGFLGQALFTFRMVLQWLASEKQKRSVIPVGFWWGSLFGGILLFAYFVWRKDVVGILGQSTGIFVYARNLVLIYAGPKPEPAPSAPAN